MDLSFANTQLRKLCSSEKELVRKYGDRRGKIIAVRLSELVALPTLAMAYQVPHMGLHELQADRNGQFAVSLIDPYRLILEPAVSPVPRRDDGGVAVDQVLAHIVMQIVDYH